MEVIVPVIVSGEVLVRVMITIQVQVLVSYPRYRHSRLLLPIAEPPEYVVSHRTAELHADGHLAWIIVN